MTTTAKQIFDQALALDLADRSELIARLLDTVEVTADSEIDVGYEEAWAAEIKRRLAEIDAGQLKMITAEESIRRVKHRLGLK